MISSFATGEGFFMTRVHTHNLTEEVTQEMYTTIGTLSAKWSMMEFNLDALNTVLYQDFAGNKVEPELPREFVRKTRFLFKILESPPTVLLPVKDQLVSILGKIGNLSQYRHDIIHGYPSRYEPKTKKFTFVSLSPTPEKTQLQVHERHVTTQKMQDIGGEALAIGAALALITVELLKSAHGPEDLKDLLSALGR